MYGSMRWFEVWIRCLANVMKTKGHKVDRMCESTNWFGVWVRGVENAVKMQGKPGGPNTWIDVLIRGVGQMCGTLCTNARDVRWIVCVARCGSNVLNML